MKSRARLPSAACGSSASRSDWERLRRKILAVEARAGEIILFSDATSLYEPDVLRVMMPNFADPTVGCVAGRLIYVDPHGSRVGHGARSYWGYETFLKKHESRMFSLDWRVWLSLCRAPFGLRAALSRSVQRFHHRHQDGRARPARRLRARPPFALKRPIGKPKKN